MLQGISRSWSDFKSNVTELLEKHNVDTGKKQKI